jgi:hypothetical protein
MSNGLFVSSVEGHAVTRFGTVRMLGGVPSPGILIGATRDQKDPSKITWNEQEIVFIPPAEAERYAKEYGRLLLHKSLSLRSSGEYEAQQARKAEGGAQ